MEVADLVKLMQTQGKGIAEHKAEVEHAAQLEIELADVQRQLQAAKNNIKFYRDHAEKMLFTDPASFGAEVVQILENIITAKVMIEQPGLFQQVEHLTERQKNIIQELDQ